MFDWGAFTLFLYILMRISGFIFLNPIFARNGIPQIFQAGFSGILTLATFSYYTGSVEIPESILVFAVLALKEFALGAVTGFVIRFFLYIADGAGEIIDTQMGLAMARTYDPSSQAQMTVTANLINTFMILLFFAENGHITLLRMMMTSGEMIPFGNVGIGQEAASRAVELFADCALLALKLAMPFLGAELLGQVGMGVLNKVIPQINVFVINIDLKVLIGFVLLLFLMVPMSNYLLEAETLMLMELRTLLSLMH